MFNSDVVLDRIEIPLLINERGVLVLLSDPPERPPDHVPDSNRAFHGEDARHTLTPGSWLWSCDRCLASSQSTHSLGAFPIRYSASGYRPGRTAWSIQRCTWRLLVALRLP